MCYVIVKALKRIKQNIKQYAFVFAQVIVGVLILTVFLTINTSINREYDNLKAKTDDNIIKLNMSYQKNFAEGITPPTPFQLQRLSDINECL